MLAGRRRVVEQGGRRAEVLTGRQGGGSLQLTPASGPAAPLFLIILSSSQFGQYQKPKLKNQNQNTRFSVFKETCRLP